jgi:hypothetical protein
MMIAWIVMLGSRPIAAFTGSESESLAASFAGMLAHSSADDPPDIARSNGIWLSRVDENPIGGDDLRTAISSGDFAKVEESVREVRDHDRARVFQSPVKDVKGQGSEWDDGALD